MQQVPRSTIVIVDNSSPTLDSDFFPDRLSVQLDCIERLSENLAMASEESQVGIITSSPPEDGIRSSLTPNTKSVVGTFKTISRGKEPTDIEKAIKRAVMALGHGTTPKMEKRILLFIASETNIDENSIPPIHKLLVDKNVILDIVVLGDGFTNIEQLHKLNSFQAPKAIFLLIGVGAPATVSDFVLATSIGVLKESFPKINAKLQKQDPELYFALIESYKKQVPEWISKDFSNVMLNDTSTGNKRKRKPKQEKAESLVDHSSTPTSKVSKTTEDISKTTKAKRKGKSTKKSDKN